MKAMAVTSYDEPLKWIDTSEPEIIPGHALIDVLTCGICFSDVKTSRGKMPFSDGLSLPHVPGHEICGQVVATDPEGAIEPGSRVVVYHLWPCRMCARCRAGEDNLCRAPRGWVGFTHPGGFQERLVVPLDRLLPIPHSISPIHAAPMTCALGTAYRAVVTRGKVTPGSRLVVLGLGGVGIHALQIARAAGAVATGLDISGHAIDAAAGLGFDARPADDPDVLDSLVAETGEGIDVVVDAVGHADTIARAYSIVRPGGRIVAVGYSVTENFVIHSPRFVLEEVELLGSRYVRLNELEDAISLVANGRVTTVIGEVKPLEQVNEAFDALEDGKIFGRVVLDIAGVS